jgi:predicted PurR-regulated permease PerM
VYGTVLLISIGWVLHVGKAIFVPAVLGAVIVYVVVGLADGLGRLPGVGPALPSRLRFLFSFAVIGAICVLFAYVLMANKDRALALAPHYQQSLLAAIQRAAVYFGIEAEPTWSTLRRDLLAQINLQRLFGSLLASVGSIVVTFVVVCLYATFLMLERRSFETKLANLSDDPARVTRIRQVFEAINRRIGSYLALKTLLSLLLGVVLPMLMAIVQFDDLGTILTTLVSLTGLQFAIGNFLDPYVMGNSLNLSPFAILASLAVWSELWGVPGAFLAVPITAILTIVFSEFPGTRPIAVLLSSTGRL